MPRQPPASTGRSTATAPNASPVSRVRRGIRGVRRRLLARRRLIAAVLAAVALAASLRVLAPAPEAGTEVVVAARSLASGSTLTDADLTRVQVGAGRVPPRAVADPVGRVLAGPLDVGEAVSETRLVGPALGDLAPGRVPVPVRLPDAEMAALLRVGDRVDLVAADPAAGAGAGAALVAAGVDVLALPVAGAGAVGGAGGGVTGLPGRVVVLGVADGDVTKVSQASAAAFVTFAWSVL